MGGLQSDKELQRLAAFFCIVFLFLFFSSFSSVFRLMLQFHWVNALQWCERFNE